MNILGHELTGWLRRIVGRDAETGARKVSEVLDRSLTEQRPAREVLGADTLTWRSSDIPGGFPAATELKGILDPAWNPYPRFQDPGLLAYARAARLHAAGGAPAAAKTVLDRAIERGNTFGDLAGLGGEVRYVSEATKGLPDALNWQATKNEVTRKAGMVATLEDAQRYNNLLGWGGDEASVWPMLHAAVDGEQNAMQIFEVCDQLARAKMPNALDYGMSRAVDRATDLRTQVSLMQQLDSLHNDRTLTAPVREALERNMRRLGARFSDTVKSPADYKLTQYLVPWQVPCPALLPYRLAELERLQALREPNLPPSPDLEKEIARVKGWMEEVRKTGTYEPGLAWPS